MIVTYKLLKEFVNFDYDVDILIDKLSLQGLEVESVKKYGGHIDKLIIGQIKEITKHPNADKLSICMVDIGKETKRIICGASNVWDKPNPKVIVALEGCFLPTLNFKIKKTKIRGEESVGMIVSEQELGLIEKSEGIWLLPDSAKVGEYPKDFIPKEDYIIEISPTANRGDLLGLLGVAREVAAMTKSKVKYPVINITENKSIEKPNITIENPELCSRFTSRIIKGIKVTDSPKWLKDRLLKLGQRPINNIVDISNYVMLEIGHPNHIYDLNKLENKQIIVRRAKANETIKTLDDIDRKLKPEMLLIADKNSAVGLAGIMGSESSEVSEETVDLLLEAAYFNPNNIRKTSKALNISTDASYRFERIADINITKFTIDRITQLISEICGGEISEMIDVYPNKIKTVNMDFKISYLKKIAGHTISKEETKQILESFEFTVKDVDEDTINLTVPTFKTDVLRPIDVVEEVIRAYGYCNIPSTTFPIAMNEDILNTKEHTKDKIKDLLIGLGLTEVVNLSFSLSKDISLMKLSTDKVIKVLNPISQDQELLRQSLIPNLIQNCLFNFARGNKNLSIFEIGHIFEKSKESKIGFAEKKSLGIVLYGNATEKELYSQVRTVDFFDMKGIIKSLLSNLKIKSPKYEKISIPLLHKGKSAEILINNKKIGYLGELHPSITKSYKINTSVIVAEISIDAIEKAKTIEKSFSEISKFPPIYRDANFEVNSDITHELISSVIKKKGGNLLACYKLIDIYIDEKLKTENKKSMTYQFIFQDIKKTLDDKKVDAILETVINEVNKVTGGSLRGI